MSLSIYVPKSKNDIEEIRQKYLSWVESTNTLSDKFKRNIDDYYISVTRVWKQYHTIDCSRVVVSATASEFSTTTYHVDAKIKGNKVYSDGQYDYYRKDDYEPAHDETSWDISTQKRLITLSEDEGDKCFISSGESPCGPTEFACNKHELNSMDEFSKYVDSSEANVIRNMINKFDFRVDCLGSISSEVEKKYKATYSGAFKFTILPSFIEDVTIKSEEIVIYPVYEIQIVKGRKKYGGVVYSGSSAAFNAPKYGPQSHDRPYKNYRMSIILSSVTLSLLALVMVFSSALSHKGLMQMYLFPMIFLVIFGVILTVLLIIQITKKRPNHIAGQEARHRSSVKWLSSTVIISVVMIAITVLLFSVTSDAKFYYTPKVVGHYVDTSGDYSEFEMRIESCDEEGNLVVYHSFNANNKTYNVVYKGKIVKKTLFKTAAELRIVEYEKLPFNYDTDDVIRIELDSSFNSVKYDFITMTRSQQTPPSVSEKVDYSAKIVGYYANVEKDKTTVLHIISCENSGEVEAEHIYIDETKQVYSIQKLYGEITDEKTLSLDITFERNEWINNTADTAFSAGLNVTLRDDFVKCEFMGTELTLNNEKLHIVTDSDAFIKTKDSSGVFILANDVDFKKNTISPLGDFSGVLLGNGHSIKNYKINASSSEVGLFESVKKTAMIVDVVIEGADITVSGSKSNVGILCGLCYGYLSNVTASGSVKAEKCEYVGGVAGRLINGSASNITVKNATISAAEYAGGCFGKINKSTTESLKADSGVTVNCTGEYRGTIFGSEEK